MSSFLFIIPLTPSSFLNENRKIIQDLCFRSLLLQSFSNWKALVIGGELPDLVKNEEKFIHVNYEGIKEEKLQIATRYIVENNLQSDYIIRLDDDDFFNPNLLEEISELEFDIYTDKFHTFYEFDGQAFSQQVRLWFPNTCIHKFEHAMAIYGMLASPGIKKINNDVRLIENNHAKLHPYYKNKKVIYANRKRPIYFRVLNRESITARSSLSYENYLKQFGYWKKNRLIDFQNLPTTMNGIMPNLKYTFKEKVYRFLQQLNVNLLYNYYLFK